jgi:hypothetical protein
MSAVAAPDHAPFITNPPAAERSESRLFEPGGVSLEDRILGTWEDLTGEGAAECPVCGGRITFANGCEDCGSELF